MSQDHLHSQVVLCGLGRSTNRRAAKYDGCRAVIIETAERFKKFGMYTVIVLPDDDTKCVRMTVKMKYLRPYEPKMSCDSVIFGGHRGLFGGHRGLFGVHGHHRHTHVANVYTAKDLGNGHRVQWGAGEKGKRDGATTGVIVYICAQEGRAQDDQASLVFDYANGKYVDARGSCAVMTGETNMNDKSRTFRTVEAWSKERRKADFRKIDDRSSEMIEVTMLDDQGIERLLYLDPDQCHMEILGAAGRMAHHWGIKFILPTTADRAQTYTVQTGIKVAAAMAAAGVGLVAAGPAIVGAVAGALTAAGVEATLNAAYAGKTYKEARDEYAATGLTEMAKAGASSVAGDHIKHAFIGDHKHYKHHLQAAEGTSDFAQTEYKALPSVAQALADTAIGYVADLAKAGFTQVKAFVNYMLGECVKVVQWLGQALRDKIVGAAEFMFAGIKYMCYQPGAALMRAYDAMADCAVFVKDGVHAVTINGANFPAVRIDDGQLEGAYMITYGYFAGSYIMDKMVLLVDGSIYIGGYVISCVESIGHSVWNAIQDNPGTAAAIGTTIVVGTMVAPPVAALLGITNPILLAGFTASVTAGSADLASWAAAQKKKTFGRSRPKFRFGRGGRFGGGIDQTQLHVPSTGKFAYYYDSNGKLCRTVPKNDPSKWDKVRYNRKAILAMK